jgi:hypothetical protein
MFGGDFVCQFIQGVEILVAGQSLGNHRFYDLDFEITQ